MQRQPSQHWGNSSRTALAKSECSREDSKDNPTLRKLSVGVRNMLMQNVLPASAVFVAGLGLEEEKRLGGTLDADVVGAAEAWAFGLGPGCCSKDRLDRPCVEVGVVSGGEPRGFATETCEPLVDGLGGEDGVPRGASGCCDAGELARTLTPDEQAREGCQCCHRHDLCHTTRHHASILQRLGQSAKRYLRCDAQDWPVVPQRHEAWWQHESDGLSPLGMASGRTAADKIV